MVYDKICLWVLYISKKLDNIGIQTVTYIFLDVLSSEDKTYTFHLITTTAK